MSTVDDYHPDDTYPDLRPDDDLAGQLRALATWVDERLNNEHADRQYALERAHDYLTWLAYRAEQVSQQRGMRLVPVRPDKRILPARGYARVPLPQFPRR
ncbi:hypothetical protein ACFQO7_14505 [Catellatospora aurea]|uniref:Uncharacterized protein n=1 Tax=Catellatospora aurea TaxID=1337874 RepID=A0ABW2GUT6_9ACTN